MGSSYYKPHTAYLATQVKTATREQLLVMLFDGAIKFCHQAKTAIEARDIEGTSNYCIKVQNIMAELMSTLNKDLIAEDLYRNLLSLYAFIHKRMIAANLERNIKAVDESLEILHRLRTMWGDAITRALQENGGKMPDVPMVTAQPSPPPAALAPKPTGLVAKPAPAPLPSPPQKAQAAEPAQPRVAASATPPAQAKPTETSAFKRPKINLSR